MFFLEGTGIMLQPGDYSSWIEIIDTNVKTNPQMNNSLRNSGLDIKRSFRNKDQYSDIEPPMAMAMLGIN
jgi:hypothetical protein